MTGYVEGATVALAQARRVGGGAATVGPGGAGTGAPVRPRSAVATPARGGSRENPDAAASADLLSSCVRRAPPSAGCR